MEHGARRYASDGGPGLTRRLGLATATALVVAEVIGVGIFLTPAGMAKSLGSPFWLLAVWLTMGAERDRRCALLRRAGGPVSGGRGDLRLPERGLRPADGLPLRLALAAGDRPWAHRHAGRRPGGLRRSSRSPVSLGAEGRGRSGRSRSWPRSTCWAFGSGLGFFAALAALKLGLLGFLRGLGLLARPRRLVESHAVLVAAAGLRPAAAGLGRRA